MLVVERASPSLRGHITRWMLEVRAGVFVGTLSSRVRELLWQAVCARNAGGGCVLVHAAQNEQGFAMLTHGDTSRTVIDIEGLTLVRKA
ncbi:type I-E CRISPR-associated endoribonuclease Cas2e [Sorangium cellulosum]|uniref:type I-E CRISPR-associated endoribonuclease Cas2e n=1 Tax=Sorangium cellulosum TaxID=56 RepID=UPI003D9A3E36